MIFLKKVIRKLYHLIWFLGAFLLFSPFVNAVDGTSETNGVEFVTAPYARMYDNTNENLTEITVNYNSTGKYYYGDLYYNGADTAGGNINFTSLTPIQSGYTYVLSILVGSPVSFKVSTKRVCIAENAANAVTRWHNNWCVTPSYTDSTGTSQFHIANSSYPNTIGYSILYYIFTSNVSGRSINIAFNSNDGAYSTTTVFGGYKLELLSDNSGLTQSQIQQAIQSSGLATANSVSQVQSSINQLKQDINSSANNIIDNNNQNTQDIINSSGSNTQSIIDNQNENSNKEIESQKVCSNKKKFFTSEITGSYLTSNGSTISNNSLSISNYLSISPNQSYTVEQNKNINGSYFCLYKQDKSFSRCIAWNTSQSRSFTSSSDEYFVRTSFSNSGTATLTGYICENGNQALDDSINDLNDSLNDSTVDSSDSTINNLKDKIPINSVISDLLLLPVRFLQNFVNALGSSCSRFSLGSLYGTELFMPCINIESYLGSGIWTTIDLIISGLFVYSLRKKFIEIYENLTNLKNGGNEVD